MLTQRSTCSSAVASCDSHPSCASAITVCVDWTDAEAAAATAVPATNSCDSADSCDDCSEKGFEDSKLLACNANMVGHPPFIRPQSPTPSSAACNHLATSADAVCMHRRHSLLYFTHLLTAVTQDYTASCDSDASCDGGCDGGCDSGGSCANSGCTSIVFSSSCDGACDTGCDNTYLSCDNYVRNTTGLSPGRASRY